MVAHSTEQDLWENLIENDDVFDALSDRQRRQLLVDLLDSDPHHVSALFDASRELTEAHEALLDQFLRVRRLVLAALVKSRLCTVDEILAAASDQPGLLERDRLKLQLYHCELPKLAEAGLIDYDWHSGDIVRRTDAQTVRKLLAAMEATDSATDSIAHYDKISR